MPLSPKTRHSFNSRLDTGESRGTDDKLSGAQCGSWAMGERLAGTTESGHHEQGRSVVGYKHG